MITIKDQPLLCLCTDDFGFMLNMQSLRSNKLDVLKIVQWWRDLLQLSQLSRNGSANIPSELLVYSWSLSIYNITHLHLTSCCEEATLWNTCEMRLNSSRISAYDFSRHLIWVLLRWSLSPKRILCGKSEGRWWDSLCSISSSWIYYNCLMEKLPNINIYYLFQL